MRGQGAFLQKNAADLAPAGAFLLFLAPQQVVGPFHMNVEPHVGQRFGDEPAHGGAAAVPVNGWLWGRRSAA